MPSSLAVTHSSAFGCSPRPPVSVSGTGPRGLKLSGFSREPPSPRCRLPRRVGVLSHLGTGRALRSGPYTFLLQPAIPSAGGGSGPPSPLRSRGGHGNVNPSPLETAGASPASLRPRLTLIRLALIRKPWSSGAGVSRPRCRYSCLHLPSRTLHRASRRGFTAHGMLPYRRPPPRDRPTASAAGFMPAHHPRPPARPVSCYALLGRMAASKPTSRLSVQADLVTAT